ncbi:hypothetical protein O1611_g3624 [Lasiodiplodia mahajangana]|uniref:Uncharacterized protein n=1 Tax=Lasiodiplodia mahajangana TaxID=1108764 RepID=A0ACC2JRG0_9PEZI|nr:hypothetical protein O1611_g3624 [Lasiodiplodia mahajangana]
MQGTHEHEHILPGTIHGTVPSFPPLPPFIRLRGPSEGGSGQPPAPAGAMEWDTTVVTHGISWPQIDIDRRHSGWEEVEKSWTRQQQHQQQQQQQQQQQSREREQQQQPAPQQAGAAGIKGGISIRPRKENKATALFPCPHVAVPVPSLESDFRMRVKLNAQSASVAVGDGFKKWTTFTEGEWSGQLGCGIVVGGGQDSQDLVYGETLATQVEATHRLKTADDVPAFIECKTRGFRTGPPELMRALQDPEKADSVDARLIQYRVTLSMKTTDERYAEKVNFGLWVGSCLWRGSEVIYDVYKII